MAAQEAVNTVALTGVVTMPMAGWIGIDPSYIVSAFLGVIIVQTLLPAHEGEFRWWPLAFVTVGSMSFSAVASPLLVLYVADNWDFVKRLPEWQVKTMVGAFAGGFAQPILIGLKALVARRLPRQGDSNA